MRKGIILALGLLGAVLISIFGRVIPVVMRATVLAVQAMVGVGYDLGWGDATMLYRHLEWDQGEDELLQGLSFSGPAVSVNYRF